MSYNFEFELSKAFEKLLQTEKDYNVIIYVGNEPNFKEVHAHSNVLCCRSEYFNELFSTEDIEKKDGKYILKKPNLTPQAVDVILKYLYTGHFDFKNNIAEMELLNIMVATDEFNMYQLTKLVENSIIENHQQLFRKEPVGILKIVHEHQSFNNLREFCLETVCHQPEILYNSDDFINLPDHLLEVILKRDDFNLIEIEIWELLIRWGLAQNNSLDEDPSKWNHENFRSFAVILGKFIPLIRFCEISSVDYINKVKPFEEILPKELRDDLYKFYMIPNYKPKHIIVTSRNKIDSVIINLKHTVQFANWIDRLEGDAKYVKSIPYQFDLIYRASRDDNTVAAFHDKCNDKGATIVVAKIKGSEQLVGGYNPIEWNSNKQWKRTFDSFIFSMKNRRNLQTANVGYCNNNKYSLGCDPLTGPNFYDLRCQDTKIWNYDNHFCYPKIDLPSSFYVDDYEVFTVSVKQRQPSHAISETNKLSQSSSDSIPEKYDKFNFRTITGKFHIKKPSQR